jgi:hypothetical protein
MSFKASSVPIELGPGSELRINRDREMSCPFFEESRERRSRLGAAKTRLRFSAAEFEKNSPENIGPFALFQILVQGGT